MVRLIVVLFLVVGTFAFPSSRNGSYAVFEAKAKLFVFTHNRDMRYNPERLNEIIAFTWVYANKYDIDPNLVLAIIKRETHFKNIVGKDGEVGYMQVKQETARLMHRVYNDSKDKMPTNIREALMFRISYNIETGVRYIAWLFDRYGGNISLVLSAYNAGHNNTINSYVSNVIDMYEELLR